MSSNCSSIPHPYILNPLTSNHKITGTTTVSLHPVSTTSVKLAPVYHLDGEIEAAYNA